MRLDRGNEGLLETAVRHLEAAGAAALKRRRDEELHASPHQVQRLFRLASPRRPGDCTLAPPSAGSATSTTAAPAITTAATAPSASARPVRCRSFGVRLREPSQAAASAATAPPATSEDSEPGAGGDPVGVRLAVLDEAGSGEGPRGDGNGRNGRGKRQQRPLDPVAREDEPERDGDDRAEQSGSGHRKERRHDGGIGQHDPDEASRAAIGRAGEPEPEHEQRVGGQRERVPVADRIAQPRGTAAVGEERRDRLARERPEHRDPERACEHERDQPERARARRAGSDPEHRERRVHETLVQLLPGAIRRDRPRDRDPAPRRQSDERGHERHAAAREREPTQEMESEHDGRREQRRSADPERVAGEERRRQEREEDERNRLREPPDRPRPRELRASATKLPRPEDAPAAYPDAITNRLLQAHPTLKHVRETLHTRAAGTRRRSSISMIFSRNQKPSRRAARLAVRLALSAVALLMTGSLGAGSAAAAESCGKKVIDDWYADGRVDGTYLPHCYDDAIEILPRDVRDYSSAKDDITRALQNRLNNKPAPPATTDPTPAVDSPETTPQATTPQTTTDETDDVPPTGSKPGDAGGAEAGGPVDTARRRLGTGPPARPRRARPPARRRRLRRLRDPATAGAPGSAALVSEPGL